LHFAVAVALPSPGTVTVFDFVFSPAPVAPAASTATSVPPIAAASHSFEALPSTRARILVPPASSLVELEP
jgi:hypothetical protein